MERFRVGGSKVKGDRSDRRTSESSKQSFLGFFYTIQVTNMFYKNQINSLSFFSFYLVKMSLVTGEI